MRQVLVDYGNVVSLPFSPDCFAEMARLASLSEQVLEERYWEHRLAYDRGGSAYDYWSAIAGPAVGEDLSLVSQLESLDTQGWLRINPDAVVWLQKLIALGHRPWLLSNAPHHLADVVETLPLASLFEGMIFSARLGVAKPERECFAAAWDAMDVAPEEIFFIDDRERNIVAAREYGMTAQLFTGHFPDLAIE